MNIKQTWSAIYSEAGQNPIYKEIKSQHLPESDWADYSREKVDDFLRSVISAFQLLDDGKPFSTLETGVFAGGTSAVFLNVLGRRYKDKAIHVGIDPYFSPDQSYHEYADDYGLDAYFSAMRQLGEISSALRVPYVPYVMSSETFIQKDLLPASPDFRLFHLDGDHSKEAVLSELAYFTSKQRKPVIFILDDIGETFPGVLEAIEHFQRSRPCFAELGRFSYVTGAGTIGFGVYYSGIVP